PIDPDAVACVHALRARVVEQQLVELRTLDVEGKAGAVTERALEREAVVAAVVDREVGAELEHADPADLIKHPEPLEDRHVHRQQRLADVEPGVPLLLQHRHLPALARQQRGDGRAGRATTDDEDVGAGDGPGGGGCGGRGGAGGIGHGHGRHDTWRPTGGWIGSWLRGALRSRIVAGIVVHWNYPMSVQSPAEHELAQLLVESLNLE